jgi:thymidylate kinase
MIVASQTQSAPYVFEGQIQMPDYNVTAESAALLAGLQQENIRFAHWKGNTHLLASLAGQGDMDILVHPDDRLLYEMILKKRAYKKLNSRPWNAYPHMEDWLGFDHATGTLLHVHTHYDLVNGITPGKYLQLPWLELFFRHLRIDKQTGWPIPVPELEALILLIRIETNRLHKNPVLPAGKQHELRVLLSQVQPHKFRDLCREFELNVPENFDSEINRILKEGNVPAILHLSSFYSNQVDNCVKTKWRLDGLHAIYYKLFLKKCRQIGRFAGPLQLKKTISSGGKMIALAGSDGSGKSTLCNELVKWLTFKVDTHYFYFGKQPFIKSYDQKQFSTTSFLFSNTIISRYFRKLAGSFYYLQLINKKINMLRTAKTLIKKNSVVICDRFPQKNVPGFFDGPKLQSKKCGWLRRLEIKKFNRFTYAGANIVFRLNISPEEAARRKPDHTLEMIEHKCAHLSHLTYGYSKVIDIDAENTIDQVLLDIKRKIWEHL